MIVLEITSLSEYTNYLESIERIDIHQNSVGSFTFFRGQSNKSWGLSPRLYREGQFEREGLLLTELQHICPSEFSNNRFETLTKMQHFGLPTRMLDATTNPLVALYFACANMDELGNDGAVYVFPNLPASWSTDPLIELIMDFVFNYSPYNLWLDEVLKICIEKYRNVSERLMPNDISSLMHYLTIPAIAVMPQRSNSRLIAQDGTFFVFGMKYQNRVVSTNPGTIGRVYYNFSPQEVDSPQKIWHLAETLIIPNNKKEKILSQLDILSINEHKLFPDLAHQTKYVVDNVKRHYKM